MKTSWKIGAGVVAGLLVGFVIGSSVQTSGFTAGSGKGDISKVSKYSRSIVSPAMSAFQEKILNDTTEMKKTSASLSVLNNRMTEFDKLVEIAAEASEGVDQLSASVASLQKVKRLAENAKLASEQALEAFNAMCEGDKKQAPNQYETASQNLALAYLMVDRQLNVAKEFVSEVDSYLRDKKVEENMDLAMARDLWVGYCTCDAVLSNDSEALAYWKAKKAVVNEDMLGYFLPMHNRDQLEKMADVIANQEVFASAISNSTGISPSCNNNEQIAEATLGLSFGTLANSGMTKTVLGLALGQLSNSDKMEIQSDNKVLASFEVMDALGYLMRIGNIHMDQVVNNVVNVDVTLANSDAFSSVIK